MIMKKMFIVTLLVTMYLPFQNIKAQQADRVQRGQRGYIPPAKPDGAAFVELKDPNYEVSIMLPKCVETFRLDDFEKEIVKGMLLKKFENQNTILEDKSNSREDRKLKLLALDKGFYKELLSILSQEEIEHFKIMDFTETREEKKKKKREKRKKGE